MVRFPDDLQKEYEAIHEAYFSQCDPDADFDQVAWDQYFSANASQRLKSVIRQTQRYIKSRPTYIHV